jgi:cysteine dioxygenase
VIEPNTMTTASINQGPVRTIPALLQTLGQVDSPLDAKQLADVVDRVALTTDQWRAWIQFDPTEFCFRPLFRSRWLEVNLIGWKRGQWSSVHDHRGTRCIVLVLQGTLTNRDFGFDASGKLLPRKQMQVTVGERLSRSDQAIHCCGNDLKNEGDLATLHFYSPPLPPLPERCYRPSDITHE